MTISISKLSTNLNNSLNVTEWSHIRPVSDPALHDIQRILRAPERRASLPAVALPHVVPQVRLRRRHGRYLRVSR